MTTGGTPEPFVDVDFVVEVPVKTVAVTSTTYLPYVEMIGERRAMKAYTSTFQYVTSTCLRRLYYVDEAIVEAYNESSFSIIPEAVEGVDVVIADEWSVATTAPHAPSYSMSDTHEDSVLRTAEYVEILGLFFNREREATEAFNLIAERYQCVKDRVIAERVIEKATSENAMSSVLIFETTFKKIFFF